MNRVARRAAERASACWKGVRGDAHFFPRVSVVGGSRGFTSHARNGTSRIGWYAGAAAIVAGVGVALMTKKSTAKADDQVSSEILTSRQGNRLYVPPSSQAKIKVFACNGNITLATEIAMLLGIQLGRSTVKKFADGEIGVEIHDNVRGKDVYVIQPTCFPINDNMLELILMVSALKRASAARVTAVIPYYGYARQLDNDHSMSTIAAADVAKLLEAAGVDHILAVDLHRAHVQGFFKSRVPVENLETAECAIPYFLTKKLQNPVIVAASESGVPRAKRFARLLDAYGMQAQVCMVYPKNVDADHEHHNALVDAESMNLVGDVAGRDSIVVDDMIDTGSRLTHASDVLHRNGARRVFGFATHGLLTGKAVQNINTSDVDELVIFNTVPLALDKASPKIRQLTVSALLAESIRRMQLNSSLADIYSKAPVESAAADRGDQ